MKTLLIKSSIKTLQKSNRLIETGIKTQNLCGIPLIETLARVTAQLCILRYTELHCTILLYTTLHFIPIECITQD